MAYKMRRRDKVEILLEILQNAKKARPPTRLMNRCNMSWDPFMKRLQFLVKKGFITQLPPPEDRQRGKAGRRVGSLFVNTEKGNKLLESIEGSSLSELFGWDTEV
jgi:predicted transcriptional regulator